MNTACRGVLVVGGDSGGKSALMLLIKAQKKRQVDNQLFALHLVERILFIFSGSNVSLQLIP